MARVTLTDEQVELEIQRLNDSPYVKLARVEAQVRYRRRQYLYNLRNKEKHGRELAAAGITEEILRKLEDTIEE